MDLIGRLAELATGVMFILAGGSKLAAGPAWPRQAADMGVARPLALVVPWYEILLGAAVVVGILSPWPLVVAGLTLCVFTALIVRRILDGSRPPCACFGARSDKPLGAGHIVRNLLFLGLVVIGVAGSAL